MGAVWRSSAARGLVSRPFSARELARAAHEHSTAPAPVAVDAAEWARGEGESAARAAARAQLAPHVPAAGALLTRAAGGALSLRVCRAAAPGDALLLWFDEDVLAALQMPFLTLHNIRGRKEYECEACGARFEEPNPLKTHKFMRCGDVTPRRFWQAVCERLDGAPAPEPAALVSPALASPAHASPARVSPALVSPEPAASAFRRVTSGASSPPRVEEAWAARLEAAAAEWGRARGGGHACLYCGKLYSRKYGLKIHLRTHTGYRPLRCRHCARAFGDPSNLNKHVRLHAAAAGAGHACARCGKALARRRDLERHLRAHCALSAPAPAL